MFKEEAKAMFVFEGAPISIGLSATLIAPILPYSTM